MLKVATLAVLVAATAADPMTTMYGTTVAPCVEPVGYHWRGVEAYCRNAGAVSGKTFNCPGPTDRDDSGKENNCGGPQIKPQFDDRAVACDQGRTEQLRLAIGNHMFGRKDSETDCSAWCLYDVASGPTNKIWRWNNNQQCWKFKSASEGCANSGDNEKTNAIAHFNALCPLGDTVKAHPVCPFDRLIERSDETCWESTGTMNKFPRIWRTAIIAVGNPVWGSAPDSVRFHSWSKAIGGGHDNTEQGFRDLIMQDPNVFAYSKYTFDSTPANIKTGYIAWTTEVHPYPNDIYADYNAAHPYLGYQASHYHGSASGICDFETTAGPNDLQGNPSGIVHYRLTNDCNPASTTTDAASTTTDAATTTDAPQTTSAVQHTT